MRATVAFGYISLKFSCWYSTSTPTSFANLFTGFCSWLVCFHCSAKTPHFKFSGVKPFGVQTVLPATRTSLARLSAYLRLRFPMLEKRSFQMRSHLAILVRRRTLPSSGRRGEIFDFPMRGELFHRPDRGPELKNSWWLRDTLRLLAMPTYYI